MRRRPPRSTRTDTLIPYPTRCRSRYGACTQAFHWLTVMLVLGAYVLSKGDPYSLCSAAADGLRRIHETLGMLVFVVGVLQLLWRLIDSTPVKQPMPRWIGRKSVV